MPREIMPFEPFAYPGYRVINLVFGKVATISLQWSLFLFLEMCPEIQTCLGITFMVIIVRQWVILLRSRSSLIEYNY